MKNTALKNKTILITGTSSGFGKDAAETLAKEGYTVFATMRDIQGKNKDQACYLTELSAKNDWNLTVVELDVTCNQSVEKAIQVIQGQVPHIDVLVNNAGYVVSGIAETITVEQVQKQFDTNVFGVHRMMRAVLPLMRKQKQGLVINISSVLGRVTLPFLGVYGATKFALEALTDGYRYEASPFGVEVVLVQPSAYPTDIFQKGIQPEDHERLASLGEFGKAPEAMFASFEEGFQGENAPNPHEVVEAIRLLIERPQGQRPDRTVVGSSFGADT
ncbi:MAG: SDR family oxidoreductase, partial [Cyanobacteria bacterium]|nr:SDR family oxidoreductase [Cyanobacteriota bacterium]